MTTDEILKLANQHFCNHNNLTAYQIEAFAKAIRNQTLEEAANSAETAFVGWPIDGAMQRYDCAAAIRALKESK